MDTFVQGRTMGAQHSLRGQAVSKEMAVQLAAQGTLEKIFLMPLEFGGVDAAVNVLYVPPGVAREKNQFDAQVRKLLEQGEVNYQAIPEYNGDSVIPSSIELEASGPEWVYHVIDVDAYL